MNSQAQDQGFELYSAAISARAEPQPSSCVELARSIAQFTESNEPHDPQGESKPRLSEYDGFILRNVGREDRPRSLLRPRLRNPPEIAPTNDVGIGVGHPRTSSRRTPKRTPRRERERERDSRYQGSTRPFDTLLLTHYGRRTNTLSSLPESSRQSRLPLRGDSKSDSENTKQLKRKLGTMFGAGDLLSTILVYFGCDTTG